MKVVIVTNPELGWDCVVGVFPHMQSALLAAGREGWDVDTHVFHNKEMILGENNE